VRREHPGLPICFYGLDATVSRELIERELAAPAIAGEYEPALTAWVDELAASCAPAPDAERPIIHLQRGTFDPPARELLPGLERYACLAVGGEERLVGYVEASHGCVHRCRHCPVPTVYDGRIRVVQAETARQPDPLAAAPQSLRSRGRRRRRGRPWCNSAASSRRRRHRGARPLWVDGFREPRARFATNWSAHGE
jgi:hypothetical protein